MKRLTIISSVILLAAACGGFEDQGSFGTQGFGEAAFAIRNAEGESNVLRTGTSVNVRVNDGLELEASQVYRVIVRNLDTGNEVARSQLLTDARGQLELTTVAHDLGEYDDVEDTHTLSITVESLEQDPNGQPGLIGKIVAEVEVPVVPVGQLLKGHGFKVDELQPPHVYSAQANGKPANAFVVGAVPDPGELGAPLFAAGRGLPSGVTSVDVYLVRDGDRWQHREIPQQNDVAWIAGPVVGQVIDGVLQPTELPWQPSGANIGPYDIIVDVDRDGRFDWSFSEKDGADGEDKVGLTIQYGAAWHRAKQATDAAGLSAAAALQAQQAAETAANEAEAAGSAPEAQQRAAAARKAADDARAQQQLAKLAASAAREAFERELADAKLAEAKAQEADDAARATAELAKAAAAEASNAQQAQLAWQKVIGAKMTAAHLLVNLAFDAKSRKGSFRNAYSVKEKVYSYINPPLQRGDKHASVAKILVNHKSFTSYWNNPNVMIPGGPGGIGRIPYGNHTVTFAAGTGGPVTGTVQQGCTNSPPTSLIFPETLPVETADILMYDVVFDYGNDGYYDIGVDWLDVIGHDTGSGIFSAADLLALPDAQVYGLKVSR